jgi:hypothetical protein
MSPAVAYILRPGFDNLLTSVIAGIFPIYLSLTSIVFCGTVGFISKISSGI